MNNSGIAWRRMGRRLATARMPPGHRADVARTLPERRSDAARTLPGRRLDAPLGAARTPSVLITCVNPMILVCFRGRLEPVWEAWRRCPGGVRTSSGQRSDSVQAASGRRRIRRQPTPATYKNHSFLYRFYKHFQAGLDGVQTAPRRRSGGVRVASGRRPSGVQAVSWRRPGGLQVLPGRR